MVISEDVQRRFWDYVACGEPDECWLWTGGKVDGYGAFGGRPLGVSQIGAHRVAWMIANGDIPKGAHVHHVCVVRACVNPAHLELRTPRDHAREEGGFVPANIARTHCPHGHPYAGDNLYVNPQGKRCCRECMRESTREWRREQRALSPPKRRSRLPAEAVEDILTSAERGIDLAAKYGVSKSYISNLRTGTRRAPRP
jgi:hypothetical protein